MENFTAENFSLICTACVKMLPVFIPMAVVVISLWKEEASHV